MDINIIIKYSIIFKFFTVNPSNIQPYLSTSSSKESEKPV